MGGFKDVSGQGEQQVAQSFLRVAVVLLPAPGRSHLLKACLHLLKHFGRVAHNQLHSALGSFQKFHSPFMLLTLHALKRTDNGCMV